MTTFLEYGQTVLDRRAAQGVRGIRSERHRDEKRRSSVTIASVFCVSGASSRAMAITQAYTVRMVKPIDRTGLRIGRLTVLEPAGTERKRGGTSCRLYRVRCDCGVEKVMRTDHLRGQVISCGCAKSERMREARTRHGMHGRSEYTAWCSMKDRCTNPKARGFENYGGRGVRVCEAWMHSFEAFFAHVGPKPSSQHSLDRINPFGDYTPGNVRWATFSQQVKNRRENFTGCAGCVRMQRLCRPCRLGFAAIAAQERA